MQKITGNKMFKPFRSLFHGCLLLGLVFILGSCSFLNSSGPIACTKIGCSDGIALKLSSSLPTSSTIEIITESGTLKTLSCDQGFCTGNFVMIEGITPEQFTIKISNNGAVLHESSHQPTYTINKPNGPDCPPDCKQTELNIAV